MKKGVIKITDSLYRGNYQIASLIFKDFRPTHIEFRQWENNVWYLYGESENFDEIKEGEIVPEYKALITTQPDGNYLCSFTKIKS
jgi:hypothetical protein